MIVSTSSLSGRFNKFITGEKKKLKVSAIFIISFVAVKFEQLCIELSAF